MTTAFPTASATVQAVPSLGRFRVRTVIVISVQQNYEVAFISTFFKHTEPMLYRVSFVLSAHRIGESALTT